MSKRVVRWAIALIIGIAVLFSIVSIFLAFKPSLMTDSVKVLPINNWLGTDYIAINPYQIVSMQDRPRSLIITDVRTGKLRQVCGLPMKSSGQFNNLIKTSIAPKADTIAFAFAGNPGTIRVIGNHVNRSIGIGSEPILDICWTPDSRSVVLLQKHGNGCSVKLVQMPQLSTSVVYSTTAPAEWIAGAYDQDIFLLHNDYLFNKLSSSVHIQQVPIGPDSHSTGRLISVKLPYRPVAGSALVFNSGRSLLLESRYEHQRIFIPLLNQYISYFNGAKLHGLDLYVADLRSKHIIEVANYESPANQKLPYQFRVTLDSRAITFLHNLNLFERYLDLHSDRR